MLRKLSFTKKMWNLVNLTKLKNGARAKDSKADGHFEISYFNVVECELHLAEIWLRLERGPVIF